MAFYFNHEISQPLYKQLYEYLKSEIQFGRLNAGEKLPSIRALALDLKVSKQTIDSAYQQLLAEGYIESRPKKGLYVLPMEELNTSEAKSISFFAPNNTKSNLLVDFYYGAIDQRTFPLKTWKRCINDAMERDLDEVFSVKINQTFGL